MKNFLERATSLLERGLSVIPIKPRDKTPIYGVAAGSVRPKTGLPYRVINDVPLASMGQGLYRHLESLAEEATREINRVILQWDGKEKIGEGSRQYFLRSQAGKLWNGERTEEEMFAVLQELNQKFCDPPKSDGELSRLVTWVMQKEPNPPAIQVTLGGTLPNKEPEKWDALNRGVF